MPQIRACVLECEGYTKLYGFPDEEKECDRRKEWLKLLGVQGPMPKYIYACSKHFSAEMRMAKSLKRSAVPDRNLCSNLANNDDYSTDSSGSPKTTNATVEAQAKELGDAEPLESADENPLQTDNGGDLTPRKCKMRRTIRKLRRQLRDQGRELDKVKLEMAKLIREQHLANKKSNTRDQRSPTLSISE